MSAVPLPRKKNLRADAAWVIYQILENGKSSRECLHKVQQRHSAQDSAWLQEMSMGVLRQLPQLQVWLRQLLDTPLKNNKKILEHLILLGFYQLAFSRVSAHAAVGETVNAADFLGGKNLRGLVNAVLRNFQRQALSEQRSTDPIIQSGMPKWLYKKLQQAYPDQLNDIIAQSNAVAPIWLRVNQRQISRTDYQHLLDDAGLQYALSDAHPDGLILLTRRDIPSLPGFAEGLFSVQDGAAQLAAAYLDALPGETVLDACAAPGGKTAHILERQPKLQDCIALDNDSIRLKRVAENMQRLKLSPQIICADAADPQSLKDAPQFDRILLDAPCSATGVIRRHPDIRWLRKRTDIEQLVELQARILDTMWSRLKPGGTLLYATCSLLPDENRDQILAFLARQDDARHSPLHETDTAEAPGRQILPAEQQMDGFYYCRLVKSK